MAKVLAIVVTLIGLSIGAPIEESVEDTHDLLSESGLGLNRIANILMSPHISDKLDTTLDQLSSVSELKSNGLSLPSLPSLAIKSHASEGLSLPSLDFHSSTHLTSPALDIQANGVTGGGSVRTSHLLEASKDSFIGAATLPLKVGAETKAIGGAIPAAAAVKGSAMSSAIATPIIVKAVALPGVAAVKTAAVMAVPELFLQNIQSVPELVSNRLKSSFGSFGNIGSVGKFGHNFGNLGHNLAELVVVEPIDAQQLENEGSIAFNKESESLNSAVSAVKTGVLGLKAGAIGLKAKTAGLAAKGLLVAKKGVYTAGRIIMKPIAIIAGAHLKMLGTGLTLGGKLIGGTGAGIAKTGTAIKYAGLGGLGVGASAVAWGFDKSTIGSHFTLHESEDNSSDD